MSSSATESPDQQHRGGVHRTVNRWLSTIALLLSIIILAAIIIGGVRLITAANEIGDRLGELGGNDSTTSDSYDPGDYSYDSGTGLNEDGTPYVQPDDADPGSYIGPLNPDGAPCVGYGCTPEQDAELDAQEGAVPGRDGAGEGGDLETRCSDGTATVEECFGPGSDENDNGIADVNE
ncbi:hypothetical protein [Blastococcus sp. SYSU DS1024]